MQSRRSTKTPVMLYCAQFCSLQYQTSGKMYLLVQDSYAMPNSFLLGFVVLIDPNCIAEVQGIKMCCKHLHLYNRLVLLSALAKNFLCSVCIHWCRHSWVVKVLRTIAESSATDTLMTWSFSYINCINEYMQIKYEYLSIS